MYKAGSECGRGEQPEREGYKRECVEEKQIERRRKWEREEFLCSPLIASCLDCRLVQAVERRQWSTPSRPFEIRGSKCGIKYLKIATERKRWRQRLHRCKRSDRRRAIRLDLEVYYYTGLE